MRTQSHFGYWAVKQGNHITRRRRRTFWHLETLPINISGGLISKGHPLGATGIGMVVEMTQQLRGESIGIQMEPQPKVALFHNAGGMIGFDEAVAVVGILERVT